ncbi:hypothetical protein EF405_05215 [Cyclobacteriaceae bacterium YHN15]|jgi:hypothetical protein|nr:hypothetical protein EF405_05215 [Cyclobacteriaceae bacterium YHN15]
MKKLAILFLGLLVLVSCQEKEDSMYTGNEISYNLYQGSDFDYTGKVNAREMVSGEIEITVELIGKKETSDYYFPAHLHFGSYDSQDSPIAYLLNAVDLRDLKSVTILGQLSDGRKLSFDEFKSFDGHVKVHLADSGPEYQVILTAGNIGKNDNSPQAFKVENMTMCSPYY